MLKLRLQPCHYLTTQFLEAGYPSCCPTSSIKALKAVVRYCKNVETVADTVSVHTHPVIQGFVVAE